MMAVYSEYIGDFPCDDALWWIRWVDYIRHNYQGTGSPSVDVLLSRLPFDTTELTPGQLRSLVNTAAPTVRVPVLAGALPRLVRGTVFQNGFAVGELPFAKHSFIFDIESIPQKLLRVSDILYPSPPCWPRSYPYRLLNVGEFPLKGFLNSWCTVLDDGTRQVILPQSEILRTLFAPHRLIALALLSGAWEETHTKLIDVTMTRVVDETNWQIALHRDISSRHSAVLANLILNPAGCAAANAIYANQLDRRNLSHLVVPLPFEAETFQFEARCIQLRTNPEKWLVVAITGVKWPGPNVQIDWFHPHKPESGEVKIASARKEPLTILRAADELNDDEEREVLSSQDPSAYARSAAIYCGGPVWSNAPTLRKLKRPISQEHDEVVTHQVDAPPGQLSAGNSAGRGSKVGRAAYQSSPDVGTRDRYDALCAELNRMLDENLIDAWRPVEKNGAGRTRGGRPLWLFPIFVRVGDNKKSLPWSYADGPHTRIRTALVCEIMVRGSCVYWVEIQMRDSERGMKSYLFVCGNNNIYMLITLLLEWLALYKGRIPNSMLPSKLAGISKINHLTHSHIRSKKEDNRACAFSSARILKAINDVTGLCSAKTVLDVVEKVCL
jgi:hypothetical protein